MSQEIPLTLVPDRSYTSNALFAYNIYTNTLSTSIEKDYHSVIPARVGIRVRARARARNRNWKKIFSRSFKIPLLSQSGKRELNPPPPFV